MISAFILKSFWFWFLFQALILAPSLWHILFFWNPCPQLQEAASWREAGFSHWMTTRCQSWSPQCLDPCCSWFLCQAQVHLVFCENRGGTLSLTLQKCCTYGEQITLPPTHSSKFGSRPSATILFLMAMTGTPCDGQKAEWNATFLKFQQMSTIKN